MLKELKIKTSKKQEIVDIIDRVKKVVSESGVREGLCVIYVPHTTAGIIINENYDKRVCNDILNKLEELIPQTGNYEHGCIDDNAHAHIKASIIGPSKIVIIKDRKLSLGNWQGIALVEFDGPKERNIFVKIFRDDE